MKICYLADANSVHTKKWCNYFTQMGYDIHVISLTKGTIEGTMVHYVGQEDLSEKCLAQKLKYLTALGKIKRLIKNIQPDILHAHYATSYGLIGNLLKFHPFVLSVWGSDIYIFPKSNIINKLIIKNNFHKADFILSTSYDMKREISLYTNKNILVTPFGINIEKFRPLNNMKNHEKFIIGNIKTLKRVYANHNLIKAYKFFTDKYDDVDSELRLAGIGPELDNLKNLVNELGIHEKVKFLGFLEEDKVIKQFNEFNIAIIPSLSESFGVSALEAQSCATPVIVSNVGGLPEVIENGKTGFLVEPNDVEGIFKHIETLYLNKQLREAMGFEGRKFVEEKYNLTNNLGIVDDFYKSIINKY